LVERLEDAAAFQDFELLVYTVMPDHVHILAAGLTEDANAVRFMQRFKQTSGYAFAQQYGHRLWQQSFFDRVLRRDEDVTALARYILENPVRAGLISTEVDRRGRTELKLRPYIGWGTDA
jgi:REP element-mobilizing transposase RayT